jgi:hypothetical protein
LRRTSPRMRPLRKNTSEPIPRNLEHPALYG